MEEVRRASRGLARQGKLLLTQGDATLDPEEEIRGPIRLRKTPAGND